MNLGIKQIRVIGLIIGILLAIIGSTSLMNMENDIYQRTTDFYTTEDGVSIRVDIFEPAIGSDTQLYTEQRPAVIAVHGFGVSKEFFTNYGIEFARLGIITVSIELRGMGRSRGDFLNGNYSEWINGVDFSREMTEQFPDIYYLQNEMNVAFSILENRTDIDMDRIALIGHSTGGGVILEAAATHSDKVVATVGLAPLPMKQVNATSHRNLLIVLGRFDEAFSYERELELLRTATGNPEAIENTMYGSFTDGTARKFLYTDFDDHSSETFNPSIMEESVNWIVSSLETNKTSISGTVSTYTTRIALIMISIIGFILTLIILGSCFLEITQNSEKWGEDKRLVKRDPALTEIPVRNVLLSLIGLNIICFPVTGGFFFLVFATGMSVAAFITPFFFTYALSVVLFVAILNKKQQVEGKKLFKEYCIPTSKEILFGFGVGAIILALLQTHFGNYFLNMLPPVHKIWATVLIAIGMSCFMIANEFISRAVLQIRWNDKRLNEEGLKSNSILDMLKAKVYPTLISTFIVWISILIGVFLFSRIVTTNFIWMIAALMLPILLMVNLINAIWFPAARRIPPIAFTFVIPIASALIAMSTFIGVWA